MPLNQFAADRGVDFYDRDWIEASFQNSANLKQLIAEHSYAEVYLTEVLETAAKLDRDRFNIFIMADFGKFTAPIAILFES